VRVRAVRRVIAPQRMRKAFADQARDAVERRICNRDGRVLSSPFDVACSAHALAKLLRNA